MDTVANILSALAVVLAYGLGRWHQADREARVWQTYWDYLKDRRSRVSARFDAMREHVD